MFDYSYDVKRCSRCKLLQYCGTDCQLKDWQSFHKHGECRLFHKLSSVPNFAFESLMGLHNSPLFLRTHLLLKAKPQLMHQKFKMHDGTERSLAEVPDDAAGVSGIHPDEFTATNAVLRRFDRSNYPEENVPALLSLYQKIRKSHLIIGMAEMGFGLYVPLTGLKHSCRPNTAFVFKGKKLEVRAMRDIAGGEDVTIARGHLMMLKAARQKQLATLKGIQCDCDRCREGDQENEAAELAATEEFRQSVGRLFMPSPEPVVAPHRSIFDGFMRVMKIEEKYQGRYHPDFVYSMFIAAFAAPDMPYKTVKDKQNFDLLVERLKEAIPLTFGLDDENVNMRDPLFYDQRFWSYLLP